ncbi:MAG: HWE histidine kinase domain-containing protein [Mesorhizobium sp.]
MGALGHAPGGSHTSNPASHRYRARTYLLGLIAVAVVPVWAFAAYLLMSFAMAKQEDYREAAVQLARQAAAVVDGELNQVITRLDGLARSSELAEANFAKLHAEARRLVAGTDQIVLLRKFGEEQVLNTQFDFGTALPAAITLTPEEVADFHSKRIRISGVYASPIGGEPRIAVARPVTLAPGDTLVMAITVPTSAIHAALVRHVPAGWVVGIGDRTGVYVTRSERHEQVTGKPGLPDYLEKAAGQSGTFVATNQFGEVLLAGYVRSALSGWLFGANVPLAVVEAPLWQSFWGVLGMGALAMLLSAVLAYLVGKSLTRETAALASRAMSLGEGRPVPPLKTRLAEFALVSDAFQAAQSMLRKRTSELETVLETVPAAVWFTYDPEARQVIRNRYAAELMGLSLEEHGTFGAPDMVIDTVAMKDGRSVPREDRPLTRAMRGEHTDHEEFAYYLPDGTERILLSSARPIYDAAGRTVVGAVQISLDISERKRAEEQRQLLTKELDHRVKNNLAIVQALAQQTLRNSSSLSEATTVLGARLAALSRAQDVLTRNSWAEGDLREVIDASVLVQAPHGRIEIAGPVVKLSPRQVMAVTLAMHELTTNAVKYGALGERGGRVRIDWQIVKERPRHVLRLTWLESGGPPVAGEPEKKGFGSRLLEQVAAGEGGRAEMRFTDDGLRCTLVLPMQTTIVADEAPALG